MKFSNRAAAQNSDLHFACVFFYNITFVVVHVLHRHRDHSERLRHSRTFDCSITMTDARERRKCSSASVKS